MGPRHDIAAIGLERAKSAARRFCAATQEERDTIHLIRFVAGPAEEIVPDLARKLPGRGVWITADRVSIQTAIKRHSFSRSLKKQVRVADDLADLVEKQLVNRVIGGLALANKAGAVATGFENIQSSLETLKIVALLHGKGCAEGGRTKLDRKLYATLSSRGDRPIVLDCLTIDEMSLAIGRDNVVHAALKADGAAQNFIGLADRLVKFRAGIDATALAHPSEDNPISKDV